MTEKFVEDCEWEMEAFQRLSSKNCEELLRRYKESLSLPSVVGSLPTETDHCVWRLLWHNGQYYATGCEEVFSFEDRSFKFCPFCGKEIEAIDEK